MTNRKSYGVFITLVVATALVTGFGSAARAEEVRSGVRPRPASVPAHVVAKPAPGPMQGEPDFPNPGPLPPKGGAYPTGVPLHGPLAGLWARYHVLMWMWLGHRIP